ncbi:glycine zipper 2TM domain-containing protein [Hydrogenophaga sp.]|uniref:glycine zipper 2TM domain-containing protein n=1 Tax=Hydrogenophaga sp. TaxID=1904254 RepID=UPI0027203210|nr:glycine zipper 2TM domain-containing protein [Hydrogenophaga sp.]MDO8904114.1 glycine zipper 2TM domain-containing protein [Hydrogenophaga sp.]
MKTSFKPVLIPVLAGLIGLSASGLAQAKQERARVISSTPVVQQIAVPRDVCYDETVYVPARRIGAGAVIGGIAGGAMGNAIGDGNGRALATMIGLVGGAVVGNHIEAPRHASTQVVRNCTTQTHFENRTVGYNVVYRYSGVNYNVQMPQDPGRYVNVNVAPAYSGRPHHSNGRPHAMQTPAATRVMVGSQSYTAQPDIQPVHYQGGHRNWR